ncbi:hypothetical protein KKG36_02095 [Patescibacteria group bacterium]|nr:hypothetical protein [Patescibacteria group bacterium]
MEYKEQFSPWYDANKQKPVTGKYHQWKEYNGAYYGPAFQCADCKKTNVGWNLWKEDYLPDCLVIANKHTDAPD